MGTAPPPRAPRPAPPGSGPYPFPSTPRPSAPRLAPTPPQVRPGASSPSVSPLPAPPGVTPHHPPPSHPPCVGLAPTPPRIPPRVHPVRCSPPPSVCSAPGPAPPAPGPGPVAQLSPTRAVPAADSLFRVGLARCRAAGEPQTVPLSHGLGGYRLNPGRANGHPLAGGWTVLLRCFPPQSAFLSLFFLLSISDENL